MSPTSKLYEILALSLFWSRILRLFPPVVSISSPGPLTREAGEDVVFMFNTSTNILEVSWGIRDGDTNNLRQGLIRYSARGGGVQLDDKLDSSSYAGRVSFVGNVTKGQAWFKITNLNINDTNEYMAKIYIQGASAYSNIPVKLTVIQPASLDSPSLLQRESGEDVVFMFNASTNILEVKWGIRDGDTNLLKLGLITVDTSSGVQPNPNLHSTRYAGRVGFVGSLTKGQAWFKITNLNINDTNQYIAKILTQGASNYKNSPVKLTIIQPATVPTSTLLLPSTKTATLTSTTSFKITTSPEPATTMVISKDKSGSDSTCTTVIAISVTINVGLVLVVVFLVVYIWKGKKRKGKAQRRPSKNLKAEELGVYENTNQTQITSESVSSQVSGKELYETLNENRDEVTTNPHSYNGHGVNMVKDSHSPTANIQGPLSSLPQHYQELRRETSQPIPLYEPLDQRNIGDKTESTGDTKTYEQLHQNKPGRDYQSLRKYANVESKV